MAGAAANITRLDIVGTIVVNLIDWRRTHARGLNWIARGKRKTMCFATNFSSAGEVGNNGSDRQEKMRREKLGKRYENIVYETYERCNDDILFILIVGLCMEITKSAIELRASR